MSRPVALQPKSRTNESQKPITDTHLLCHATETATCLVLGCYDNAAGGCLWLRKWYVRIVWRRPVAAIFDGRFIDRRCPE